MEIIREIVTTIVIILVLSALLEMILPNSNMQRFVKVVMGLFIIVTLLNPIVGLMNKDLSKELLNWQVMENQQELKSILAKGQAISEGSKEKAVSEYEKRLGQQILSLTRLSDKSSIQDAEVKVNKEGAQGELGGIKEVTLYLGDAKTGPKASSKEAIEPVSPIKVELSKEAQKSQTRDPTNEVLAESNADLQYAVDAIINFYSLDKEQVKVIRLKE